MQQAILAGGDDYELCFTAAASQSTHIQGISASLGLPLTCIGRITKGMGLHITYQSKNLPLTAEGYDHFG